MSLERVLPLLALVGLAAVAYALHLERFLTLDALRDNRSLLLAFVSAHRVGAALVFVVIYIGVVALSLPGATIMTLGGGFLFGVGAGAALSVVGATCGAAALFLIARSALGELLRRRAGPFLARMADGFRHDAFHYLLFLRLVPAFPFFAVNLAAALLGMPMASFVAATAIGILPAALIFAAFGAGLGRIFDAGGDVDLKDILNPTLIAGLIGLGFLALLPVIVKRMRENRP
ncbi:TVP38/TMEM64 family protein [Methylocapsa aurea]|uniref:TVP38/TMEM64 family protein n=1 Tax=Methylocapsa aurea TaxID=663610 RepID=UPI00056AF731|nr:VTT domain-containing protein [Methylocapsa aurea]